MRGVIHSMLCALVLLAGSSSASAQEHEALLADMIKSPPGKERAQRLVDLSRYEREHGRYREAVEFAILGSSEAERAGLETIMASAFIQLAEAHRAKGDLDNAIGASIRATMLNGTFHSGLRTEAMLQLAELYNQAGHPQKALEHLEEAMATTGAGKMDRARYFRAEIAARSMVVKPDAMIKYCAQAKEEIATLGSRSLMLDLLSALATAQAKAGRNKDALGTEMEVMKLAIALDRPMEAAICANNMGELHQRSGNPQEAMIAFGKGLILVEDKPLLRLNMQINAAHANATNGNLESAIRLIDEADRNARSSKFKALMPRLLRTKAAIQLLQGDPVEAQNTGLEALAWAEEGKDKREQIIACDLLANIFEQRDLAGEARTFNAKARDLEQQMAVALVQAKSDRDAQLLRLQRIEREQGDLMNREQRKEVRLKQLALDAENREKQMALLVAEKQLEEAGRREQSFLREKADKELLLTQAALQDARQERMIQELDNGRMLQALNVTKLEFEQKEQLRALETLEQRNEVVEAKSKALLVQREHDVAVKRYSIMGATGAVLLAIYMAWAWMVTRKKQRIISLQNKQIRGINTELAEKNQNIQSSLDYAQTIQSAILPTEEDLRNTIADSFLFYKPLDTVSGDLPFLKRIGDKVFIAAIDCTGHGVPAAMMTFIAYYGLTELLTQDPKATCGQLLDRLHEHVKRTMDARGTDSLYIDGFDIGLCSLDLDTGDLSFAGAQLPVLLVRNGEVIRTKGDVLPLGDSHFERNSGYKNHDSVLQNGDALFLFSDGIIHQFGGEGGRKKFSMKKLTEELSRTAHMDLLHVKEQTERSFEDWKGSTPQTDDVLLIGFRYAA